MKTISKSKTRFVHSILGLLLSVCSYSQIPIYNSYPSAPATVYLDFDGQYLEGTSWNYIGPLSLGPSNMTNEQITEIFNRVAEDYRPFKINVTTDSTKYWSAPVLKRMRVVFTVTSSWYGAAGGVSYINSFSWGDNTPCFVFTALLNYRTKYVAEAASHEIGHTLGLNHQSSYDASCNMTAEYNQGIGSGEIAWAPIMGVGYYRNLTLWHYGSNPWGCSSYQDDLSIITRTIGFRDDDYSGNISGNMPQSNFVNNRFTINGIIETVTDKDVFKFTMPTQGLFRLDANPYSVGSGDNGSNLDVQLELLGGNKNVLNTYNPDLTLSATIDTMLNAGTYYLRVQGSGNIYAPDYASLGSYTLSAAYLPSTVLPLHRLQLSGDNDKGKHRLSWIIEADEKVAQQTLEVSADAKTFHPVGVFNTTERNYTYVPGNRGTLYYRLNVSFDNNKEYYSNIITIKDITSRPMLRNTTVHHSIEVNTPSKFSYAVVDYSGRTVAKGNLVQGLNSISTDNLSNGMYVIQFSNGQEQYAEKFMKQ
ncbi:MAG TPA: T9SS type A sorting domain-containing protein [Flavisolibacter sp.]|nr:T9SS type A sorting domain-containing protein [Flavisolibacter sp.]